MIETELLKKKIEESGYRFNWIAKQLNLSPFGMRKKVNVENIEIESVYKQEKKYFFNLFRHLK